MAGINKNIHTKYAEEIKDLSEQLTKNNFDILQRLINSEQKEIFKTLQLNKHIVSPKYIEYLDNFIDSLRKKTQFFQDNITWNIRDINKLWQELIELKERISEIKEQINNLENQKNNIDISQNTQNQNGNKKWNKKKELQDKIDKLTKELKEKEKQYDTVGREWKKLVNINEDLKEMIANIPQRKTEYDQIQSLLSFFDYDIPLSDLDEKTEKTNIAWELHSGLSDDIHAHYKLYTENGMDVKKINTPHGQGIETELHTVINNQPIIIKTAKIIGLVFDENTWEIDMNNVKAYDQNNKEIKDAYSFMIYPGAYFSKSLVNNPTWAAGLASTTTAIPHAFDSINTEEFINFKPLTIKRAKDTLSGTNLIAAYNNLEQHNGNLLSQRAGEFFDQNFETYLKDYISQVCEKDIGPTYLQLDDNQKIKLLKKMSKEIKSDLSTNNILTRDMFKNTLFKDEITKKSFIGDQESFKNHIFNQLDSQIADGIGEKTLKKSIKDIMSTQFNSKIVTFFNTFHTTLSQKDDPQQGLKMAEKLDDSVYSAKGVPNTGFWSNFSKKPAATLYNKIKGIHKDYNLTDIGSNSYLTFIGGLQENFSNSVQEKDKKIDFTTSFEMTAYDNLKANINIDGQDYGVKGTNLQYIISWILNDRKITNNKIRTYASLNIIKALVKKSTDLFGELRILRDINQPKSKRNGEIVVKLDKDWKLVIEMTSIDEQTNQEVTTKIFDETEFINTNDTTLLNKGIRRALQYTNITLNNYNKRYQSGLMNRQNNRFKTQGAVILRPLRAWLNKNDNKRDFSFNFTCQWPKGEIKCSFDKGLIILEQWGKKYQTKNIEYLLRSSEFFGAQIDILKNFYGNLATKLLIHTLIAKKNYAVKCPDTGRIYVLDRHGDIGYFMPESTNKPRLRSEKYTPILIPNTPLSTNRFIAPLQRAWRAITQGVNKTLDAINNWRNTLLYNGEDTTCGVIREDLKGINHGYVLLQWKERDQLLAKPELMGKLTNIMIRQMGAPVMKPLENAIVSLEKKLTFA